MKSEKLAAEGVDSRGVTSERGAAPFLRGRTSVSTSILPACPLSRSRDRMLAHCRIAHTKTIGGLSDRQRAELLELLGH